MNPNLKPSELVLDASGRIYHLQLAPDELAKTIILVGDPGRVPLITKHFDSIEIKRQHREFLTHTGHLGKQSISVVATGISTANIDIVLNELDALVNIDFAKREVKKQLTQLNIIRVGTAGSLHESVELDSYVLTEYGITLGSLMQFYPYQVSEEAEGLLNAFNQHTQFNRYAIKPTITEANSKLFNQFESFCHTGITITCPGFYAPQGRHLRLPPAIPDLIQTLSTFEHNHHKIANFEMETAAIYNLSKAFGHHCTSLSSIVANRMTGEFTKDTKKPIEKLIKSVLEKLS